VTGIEPATFSLGSCTPPAETAGVARACADGRDDPRSSPGNGGEVDDRLAAIVRAWDGLREAVRAALGEAAEAWADLDDRQRAGLETLAEAARVTAGRA